MPRIAQQGVDESSIQFTDLEFLDPTPDSIVLSQTAILHSPSIYTPTLDPFNASLYLVQNGTFAEEPMMYIPMPSIHALHPSSNVTIKNQELAIANLDQLTKYATAVLTQENVTTALTGTTRLHEGKLPVTSVNFNSSSTYKGELRKANRKTLKSNCGRSQWISWLQRHKRENKPHCPTRTAKPPRIRIYPKPISNDHCYG